MTVGGLERVGVAATVAENDGVRVNDFGSNDVRTGRDCEVEGDRVADDPVELTLDVGISDAVAEVDRERAELSVELTEALVEALLDCDEDAALDVGVSDAVAEGDRERVGLPVKLAEALVDALGIEVTLHVGDGERVAEG